MNNLYYDDFTNFYLKHIAECQKESLDPKDLVSGSYNNYDTLLGVIDVYRSANDLYAVNEARKILLGKKEKLEEYDLMKYLEGYLDFNDETINLFLNVEIN